MHFFNPSSILTVFIASGMGLYVAPHVALVSRTGALALRLAGGVLALGLALDFGAPFLNGLFYRFSFGMEVWDGIAKLVSGAFWGLLAWSVLAVMQSAQPRGIQ